MIDRVEALWRRKSASISLYIEIWCALKEETSLNHGNLSLEIMNSRLLDTLHTCSGRQTCGGSLADTCRRGDVLAGLFQFHCPIKHCKPNGHTSISTVLSFHPLVHSKPLKLYFISATLFFSPVTVTVYFYSKPSRKWSNKLQRCTGLDRSSVDPAILPSPQSPSGRHF